MDLVTGGAGFVGAHLVERLLADGRRVRVLDAFASQPGDPAARKRQSVQRWAGRPVEVLEGDVRRASDVRAALEGITRVYHLAGRTGARRSLEEAPAFVDTNATGTAVLLAEMEAAGVPRLVLASSAAVYGEEGVAPTPLSPYGASKVAAEALAGSWARTWERARVAVVRLFTVYGPRGRPDQAVPVFLGALRRRRAMPLIAEGRSTRDWLWVGDAVDLLVRCGYAVLPPGAPLVIDGGTGRGHTVREVASALAEVAERPPRWEIVPEQPGEPARAVARLDEAHEALGWEPAVALREGLRRTWAEG